MARTKLAGNILNLILIIVMSFFCISLMSSGKKLNDNLKAIERTKKEIANENSTSINPKSIVVKYRLVNNDDTILVDRKLDSLAEIEKN